MDAAVTAALQTDRTVEITTTGRRSGRLRRIEIWFHLVAGRVIITGMPGPRDWYANLLVEPRFTFHLLSVPADLPATAVPVTDPEERRALLGEITRRIGAEGRLDTWVAASPLVEVHFDG